MGFAAQKRWLSKKIDFFWAPFRLSAVVGLAVGAGHSPGVAPKVARPAVGLLPYSLHPLPLPSGARAPQSKTALIFIFLHSKNFSNPFAIFH
jgi:hypothetical protein